VWPTSTSSEKAVRARIRKQLLPDAKVELVFERHFFPLELRPVSRALAAHAQAIYGEIGRPIKVLERSTGGGTDASNAAVRAKGPVIEGFGLQGFGSHTVNAEYVVIDSIEPRLYLSTRLIMDIAKGRAPLGTEAAAAADEVIAIIAERVYTSPGAEPLKNATVLVSGGKVRSVSESAAALPAGARVIEAKGMSLMAGFWNSHVHFIDPKVATRQRARPRSSMRIWRTCSPRAASCTCSRPPRSISRTRSRCASASARARSRARTSSRWAFPSSGPDGTPGYLPGMKLPEFSDPKEVRAFVRKQLDAGADGVKFWSVSPTLKGPVRVPADVALAAVDEAHRSGKPVYAHPTSAEGVRLAAEYGVDVLAHSSPDEWGPELVALLKSRNVALVPTLKLFRFDPERQGVPADMVRKIMEGAGKQLAAYSGAGGTILFGTDVGYVTDLDTREEFALMGQAGMSFAQILASLTTAPAAKFGRAARTGRVEAGMDADLVLVAGDPRADVRALGDVRLSILRGKIVYRAKGL
jgi:imidazolonepropionase-like amidohydrolase